MSFVRCMDLLDAAYLAGGTDPNTGIDCLYVAHTLASRIFPDFEANEIPLTDEAFEQLARMRNGFSRWHFIGTSRAQATKLGDLLVGAQEGGDGKPGEAFVAILVDEDGAIAATAIPSRGFCLLTTRKLAGVREIYRRGALA